MCVVTAGASASAAAASAAAATNVGLAISAISSAAGIMQAQQSAQFQQQQAAQQREMARRNAEIANQQSANNLVGEVAQQKAKQDAYQQNLVNTTSAANKVAAGEQAKLTEARKKAGFKAQNIYAKSIGAKGTVLATGATGQSMGLLALDADRQAGLGLAEQYSTVDSAATQAAIGAQAGFDQKTNSDNNAYSQLGIPATAPVMQQAPGGELEAPSYDWFD